MKIGNINISNLKLGIVQIKKVFIGLDLVWTSFLSIINDFKTRVLGNQGQFEGETCLNDGLEEIGIDLFDDASIVVTPNGYKENVLYSVTPSPVGTNLLLNSEVFDNSYWTKSFGTITANDAIAPNGTMTADLFTKTSAVNTVSTVWQTTITKFLSTGIYTLSVYIKPKTGNVALLRMDGSGNTANAPFNFTTKTFTNTGVNIISSTYQELPNGWFRLSLTANVTNIAWVVDVCNLFSNPTGDAMWIWGAQLEYGSTAGNYIPTTTRQVINETICDLDVVRATSATRVNSSGLIESVGANIARLDYTNGTCPSLLVEPQRSNLFLRSDDFTNGWTQEGTSVTGNTQISPSGNLTADVLSELATNDVHRTYRSAIVTTANANYTTSFFVKKNNIRYVRLILTQQGSTTIWAGAQFDLDTQTFTSQVGTSGGTFVNATIRTFVNGWYRISVTGSIPGTAMTPVLVLSNGSAMLNTNTRGCPVYMGNTSNSLYVWGAQLELGINVTSYIPTTSTTVTRNGDVISKTAIPTLIGQTSGTIFTEVYFNTIVDIYRRVICISNGVASNRVIIVINASGRFEAYITNATGNQFTFASSAASTALLGKNKVAIAYNTNDVVFYVNGVQVASTTTATIPLNLNNLYIGKIETSTATLQMNGYFNKVYLFKSRLTNTILQNLTTL